MSDTISNLTETPERARRAWSWVCWACYGVAFVGLLAGIAVDRQLIGTTVYAAGVWLGLGLSAVVPRLSSVTFQDERDREQFHRASGLTISTLVFVGLAIVPAAYVLDAAGEITIGATGWGAIYAYGAIGLVWGAWYALVQLRA